MIFEYSILWEHSNNMKYLADLRTRLKIDNRIILFFLIWGVVIIYSFIQMVNMNIGDADWYLTIGDGCYENKLFRISKFPQTFRGCLFPIYLQILKNSPLGIRIGWALTMGFLLATLFVYIIPAIFGHSGGFGLWGFARTLALVITYIYIFGDTLTYTLSDLVASFFLILSICLLPYLDSNNMSWNKTIVVAILTGLCMYIAYNTRATFMYGLAFAVFTYFVTSKRKKKSKIAIIAALFLGIGIMAIPQCVVNYYNEGVYSPRIYTENYNKIYGNASNLQMQQIEWGLNNSRYETFVGDKEDYPTAQVFFVDRTSQEILARESIDEISIKRWFELWLKYPADMMSVYTRHIVCAMTPCWTQLYIYKINVNMLFCICISMVIWICIFLNLLIQDVNEYVNEYNVKFRGGYVIAGVIPALLQSMGAVEVRFFLPAYLLGYGYFACGINFKKLIERLRPIRIKCLIICTFIIALWICVIGGVLADNSQCVMLINNAK